jgi:hypothetical protein
MKLKVTAIPYSAVQPLLFVASIVFTVVIAWLTFGEYAIQVLACPFICTLPIVCVLASILKKKRGILGAVVPMLPVLVIPLLLVTF